MSESPSQLHFDPARPRILLLADESGMDQVAASAHAMADQARAVLVLIGSVGGFQFRPRPSTIIVPGMPDAVIASMPTLESAGIASRLASERELPGCYEGSVIELARDWLASQARSTLDELTLYACGQPELLESAQQLGQQFGLPVALATNRS